MTTTGFSGFSLNSSRHFPGLLSPAAASSNLQLPNTWAFVAPIWVMRSASVAVCISGRSKNFKSAA